MVFFVSTPAYQSQPQAQAGLRAGANNGMDGMREGLDRMNMIKRMAKLIPIPKII